MLIYSGAGDVTESDTAQVDDSARSDPCVSEGRVTSYDVRGDEDAGGDLTAFSVRSVRRAVFSLDENNGDVMDPSELLDMARAANTREIPENSGVLHTREPLYDTELSAILDDILDDIIEEVLPHVRTVENVTNNSEAKELEVKNKHTVHEAGTSEVDTPASRCHPLADPNVNHKRKKTTYEDSGVAPYNAFRLMENNSLNTERTDSINELVRKYLTEKPVDYNMETNDVLHTNEDYMSKEIHAEPKFIDPENIAESKKTGSLDNVDTEAEHVSNSKIVDCKLITRTQKDERITEQVFTQDANHRVYEFLSDFTINTCATNTTYSENTEDIDSKNTSDTAENIFTLDKHKTNTENEIDHKTTTHELNTTSNDITDTEENTCTFDKHKTNIENDIDQKSATPEVDPKSNNICLNKHYDPQASCVTNQGEFSEAYLTRHRSIAAQTTEPEYLFDFDCSRNPLTEQNLPHNSNLMCKKKSKQLTPSSKLVVQPVIGKRPTLRNVNASCTKVKTNASSTRSKMNASKMHASRMKAFGKVRKSAASTNILRKDRTLSRKMSCKLSRSNKPKKICHYMRNYVQLIVQDATKE